MSKKKSGQISGVTPFKNGLICCLELNQVVDIYGNLCVKPCTLASGPVNQCTLYTMYVTFWLYLKGQCHKNVEFWIFFLIQHQFSWRHWTTLEWLNFFHVKHRWKIEINSLVYASSRSWVLRFSLNFICLGRRLKGTVAWDFWTLVFCMNRQYLGPRAIS